MWTALATCRVEGVDPELFFPAGRSGRRALHQQASAKAVCARCPVLADCLEWAVATGSVGVWGGTTEEERDLLWGHRPQRSAGSLRATGG